MANETLGLKNVNMLTKEQYSEIAEPATDELYAISGSGFGFPSDRFVDLTLGASGSSYTAPANGWVVIGKRAGADHQYLYLINNTTSFSSGGFDTLTGFDTYVSIPVRKNDVFGVAYAMTGDTFLFRFIYAEGEE